MASLRGTPEQALPAKAFSGDAYASPELFWSPEKQGSDQKLTFRDPPAPGTSSLSNALQFTSVSVIA